MEEIDVNATKEDLNKVSKYLVMNRNGIVIGMCDNYEGFVTCAKAMSANRDISFLHNEDKSEFCCKDVNSNTILYYPKLNDGNL